VQPLLARAEELAVSGADAAKGPSERTNMASEVNELLEELVSLANSHDDGRYVLGGQETLSPPLEVTRDVAGNITAATWNPRGVDGTVFIDIAPGSSLQTSVSGTAALGDDAAATFLPTVLIQLRDALSANDPDAVRTAMGSFAAVESRLGIATADVGTRLRQAEDALANHDSDELAARAALSSILDADMGKLAAEIGQQQIAYQASLRAAALAIQPSLVDFLK
jgi:flagellar hook-associated protein 3 FlgL